MPVLSRAEVLGALALLVVCVGVAVTVRIIRFFTFFDRIRTPLDIIPTICFGAGGGLAVALLVFGVLVRLRHRHDRTGRPADEETRTPVPTA